MSILSKLIYRFSAISIQISEDFLKEIDRLILKFICKRTWKYKGPRMAKVILKKNKDSRLTLSDFQTYLNATVLKIVYFSLRIDK